MVGGAYRKEGMRTIISMGNLQGRDNLRDTGVDRKNTPHIKIKCVEICFEDVNCIQ
jgi:hypothetical protein